jgi:hypothetical protein
MLLTCEARLDRLARLARPLARLIREARALAMLPRPLK